MIYKKNTRHSNYESKIKQTLTYVQVIISIRQISVEYEVMIMTSDSLISSFQYKLDCTNKSILSLLR